MYSVVLMAALTSGAEAPAWGHGNGCHSYSRCYGCGGCYGGACYGSSCSGGCWGYSGAYYGGPGCNGFGCYGGWYPVGNYACHGCYGCYGCYGCNGYSLTPGTAMPGATPAGAPAAAPGAAPAPAPKPKPDGMGQAPDRARLIVELPADAKLYIDDQPMKTPTANRVFNTPQLDRAQKYYYMVRAEVVRDGKTISDEQKVIVQAGAEARVSFNGLGTAATANASGVASKR